MQWGTENQKGLVLKRTGQTTNQNIVNRADDKTTKSYLIIIFLLKFSKVININQLNIVKKLNLDIKTISEFSNITKPKLETKLSVLFIEF